MKRIINGFEVDWASERVFAEQQTAPNYGYLFEVSADRKRIVRCAHSSAIGGDSDKAMPAHLFSYPYAGTYLRVDYAKRRFGYPYVGSYYGNYYAPAYAYSYVPPYGITTIPCTRVTTATTALATALAAVHALSKAVDRGLPRTDRMKTWAGRGHCLVIWGRPSTSALGRRDFAPDICKAPLSLR